MTAPTVTSVNASPSTGDYATGHSIEITIDMDSALKVTGKPTLTLNSGGSKAATATYDAMHSDLATGMLAFVYKVAAGQNTPDGQDLEIQSVNLVKAAVTDPTGTTAADFSNALNTDLGNPLQIDTIAPTVTSVTTTSSGTVGSNSDVMIDVHTSEAVNVVGFLSTLALSDKGSASYFGGSGTNDLEFDYRPRVGQNTPDLLTTSLEMLKGGTIKDLAGNALNVTGAAKQNLHLAVDTIAAVVTNIAVSPSSGAVAAGSDVFFTLTFDDTVFQFFPQLMLNDSGIAGYISGSGTNALVFKYHVGSESTTDLQITGFVQAAGQDITDSAGNLVSSTLSFDTKLAINVFTFTHTTDGGGDWNMASNWTPTTVPTAGNTALIMLPGTYTVTSAQNNSVGILNTAVAATLDVQSHELDITKGTGLGANAGTIKVDDGAKLGIGGTFDNPGTITLGSTGDATDLITIGAVTLAGAGHVTLSDNLGNAIVGNSPTSKLTNVDNTISGAGRIQGDFFSVDQLRVDNQAAGVIDAVGTHSLTIDVNAFSNEGKVEATGDLIILDTAIANAAKGLVATLAVKSHIDLIAATITGGAVTVVRGSAIDAVDGFSSTISGAKVTNGGTLSAHSGDLTITTAFSNSGILDANDGLLTLLGTITGKGAGTIEGTGELEFGAAKSTSNVTFGAGATGELILDHSTAFKGTITGFSGPPANSFSQFLGFGDSSIDSGHFATSVLDGDTTNDTGNPSHDAFIKNALMNGGTGTPVGLGLMNSQILAGDFGLTAIASNAGGTNFAIAGATNAVNNGSSGDPGNGGIGNVGNSGLASTVQQIKNYLAGTPGGNKADSGALYEISSGGNDISFASGLSGASQINYLNDQAKALANEIKTLHDDGAAHIIIHDNYGGFGNPSSLNDQYNTDLRNALTADGLHDGFEFVWSDIQSAVFFIRTGSNGALFGLSDTSPGNLSLSADQQHSAFQPQDGHSATVAGWGQWGANTTTPSTTFAYLRAPNAQFTSLFSDDQHLSTIGQQIEANFDLAQLFKAGMFEADSIDLKDIPYTDATLAKFTGTATSGTLTVTDNNGHTAKLTLSGADYRTMTFVTMDDGSGGTRVIDPPGSSDSAAEIADNPLSGHYGAITTGSNFGMTDFTVGKNVSLSGDGTITLSSDENIISGGHNVTLTNHETLAGGGVIGDGFLTLRNAAGGVIDANSTTDGMLISTPGHAVSNAGVIEASGGGWLVIDGTTIANTAHGSLQALDGGTHLDLDGAIIKGGAVAIGDGAIVDTVNGDASTISGAKFTNAGTLEAGFGDLAVQGAVANSGTLMAANGSHLAITGAVQGAGGATIAIGGTLEFGASASVDVTFLDATGTLQFDSTKFSGTIAGFAHGADIDLGGITYTTGDTQLSFDHGVLTANDGTHSETLNFTGSYAQADFKTVEDVNHHVDLLHV